MTLEVEIEMNSNCFLNFTGFTGGRLWKKRQEKIAEVELANMSHKSQSMPEMSDISLDNQIPSTSSNAVT